MSTKKSNIYHHSCFQPPSPSAAPRDTIQIMSCVNSSWQKSWSPFYSRYDTLRHRCCVTVTHVSWVSSKNYFLQVMFTKETEQGSWGCSWRALPISGWRQNQSLCWLQGTQVRSYRLSLALPLVVPGRGPVLRVALWGLVNEIFQMQGLYSWSLLHTFPAKGTLHHSLALAARPPGSGIFSGPL